MLECQALGRRKSARGASRSALACGARNGMRTISMSSPETRRLGKLLIAIPNQERKDSGRSASVHVSCRACCVTHAAVGDGVQPARCTRRLPSSMKNSTHNRCSQIVSTLKKSPPSMFWRWMPRIRARSCRVGCPRGQGLHREASCAPSLARRRRRRPSTHRRCAGSPSAGSHAQDGPRACGHRCGLAGDHFGRCTSTALQPTVCAIEATSRAWNAFQRARGSSRLAAVKKSRSIGPIAGRRVRRRSIASSCRNTRISRSLKSSDRIGRASSWRTRRSSR